MRKYLFLFYLVITAFSCQPPEEVTTYYLIRHAEKDKSDPSNRNPNLTEKGLERAKNWSEYFKNKTLDAIYSTKYNRTLQTAKPTAESKELEVLHYDPRTLFNLQMQTDTYGKSVLIVGHSNTTPVFANQIINTYDKNNTREPYSNMDEDDNASLYIITIIKKGRKKSVEAKVIKIDD